MKIIKLNEQKLVEKEVLGKKPEDVQLDADTKQLMKDGKYKDAYFKVAGPETGDSSYFIYIEYTPTKKQIDAATKLNGVILGYSGSPLKGYLKESANKKLKVGWFSGNAGAELLGIVDSSDPLKVIKEPYISLVADTKDATAYSEKNAKEIVKKLSENGTGVTLVKEEKAPSKKEAFFREYLKKIFPGQEDAIKDFKRELMGLLVALEFKPNALVTFLSEYLKNNKMSKSGFITLNNTYANNSIDDVDLEASSELYTLFMSNLFVNTGVADAEVIIDAYKSILYTPSWQGFNMVAMESLKREKDPSIKLVYDKEDGSLEDEESKKNLANMVVFRKGKIGQEVESADKVKEFTAKLKSKNTSIPKKAKKASATPTPTAGSQPTKTAGNSISVSVNPPTNITTQTAKKVGKIASDLSSDEIGALLATLKKQKKI
jgi:hypothetical protein